MEPNYFEDTIVPRYCKVVRVKSPVLANIFMSKLEDDIVTPNAPALYHRYIDDWTHWSSKIPTKWKRNAITDALHRAKRISSNLAQDIEEIRTNFIKSDYPRNFVDNTIKSFQDRLHEEEPLIPTNLMEERRRITIRIPFCERNEKASSTFKTKSFSWQSVP